MYFSFQWNVYHEPADSDDPKVWIGTIEADTMGNALNKASQFYEIPSHDLVVERVVAVHVNGTEILREQKNKENYNDTSI